MENLSIKSFFRYRKSLFNRLGLLVAVFTLALTSVLFYQFHYSFSTQDSLLDAHENYYYYKMVKSWSSPPDTNHILQEIKNLHIWCGIYNKYINEEGRTMPIKEYWSNLPDNIDIDEFISWTISTDYQEVYNIEIPYRIQTGEINTMPVTVVDNGNYLFYLVIDYLPPSDFNNVIFAIVLAIIFILGLYFFISRYLKPVQLMKSRIESLEGGDLQSKIEIIGEDELAELSQYMNKMITEINSLLENKHQLLLDVSHELRSPLARMQFLIEMMPDHKNNVKLREEVNFLEGMIDNLLLSDRLSMPYSTLEMSKIQTSNIINKIMDLFPSMKEKITIKNSVPNLEIIVDETKFIIALRNLLDNAIKYSGSKEIILNIEKNNNVEFRVKDSGIGISDENIEKITQPFFQEDKSVSTKGFGLGLTICKKIIESHKGGLSIQSTKGKGSVFTLYLPVLTNKELKLNAN